MSITSAFHDFLASPDLQDAIISSTKASWGGGYYAVELFPDGRYRVLDGGQIGNLYHSPGLILKIPPLTEDEWDEENEEGFFQNAIETFEASFQDVEV